MNGIYPAGQGKGFGTAGSTTLTGGWSEVSTDHEAAGMRPVAAGGVNRAKPSNLSSSVVKFKPAGQADREERVLTILVIDDQSTGRLLISEILRNVDPKAKIVAFGDPFDALDFARSSRVDMVLTDYRMPTIDGIETIRRLRMIEHIADVPIVCVTIVDDREVRYRALEAGANDFLMRPLDPYECAARCRNLLALRQHQLAGKEHAENLERRIEQVSSEMRVSEMETLLRLARVAEQRDSFTGMHLVRMAKYSALLARESGWNEEEQGILELASPLHDIGKISIADDILQARRALTETEMSVMRTHAEVGHAMLDGGQSKYLQMAASVALGHHEKFDGSGYPSGLRADAIPLECRIVAIADVYDALTSTRHYKPAWSVDKTADYMKSQSGKHFDPELLDCFFGCHVELESIRNGYSDQTPGSLLYPSPLPRHL